LCDITDKDEIQYDQIDEIKRNLPVMMAKGKRVVWKDDKGFTGLVIVNKSPVLKKKS